MHSLNINGDRITDIAEIIKHKANLYRDLYSSDNIDNDEINSYLNNTTFEKTLSSNEAKSCDGLLTMEEVTRSILAMKTNRSPGLSGITIEFYQHFWEKIKLLVLNYLNEGFLKGELSRGSIITV